MKSLMMFVLGVVISIFVCIEFNKTPDPQVKEVVRWKEKTVYVPAKVDTFYKVIVKTKKIPVFVRDTIRIVKIDTVYIDSSRIVKTRFSFRPKEFLMFTDCYAPDKVDSIKFVYRMRQSYIDSLRNSGKRYYPVWKKMAYFIGGSLFTGTIFYLTK